MPTKPTPETLLSTLLDLAGKHRRQSNRHRALASKLPPASRAQLDEWDLAVQYHRSVGRILAAADRVSRELGVENLATRYAMARRSHPTPTRSTS